MFLLLLFTVLALGSPQQVSAQSGRLTFRMQNATLKEIINEVQRISDYDFVYSDADIAGVPRRNANFNDSTIGQVLTQVLAGTGLEGQVNGNTIVIRKASEQPATRTITGQVTDQGRQPLIGVTVVVKGTTIGVTTDANGRYSINIPSGSQSVLTFSYIGMNPYEATVGAQTTTLNVTMTESSTAIADVIVTGIFERARESYTGSVTEVTRKDLEMFRGQNLISTLANFDPAVNILSDNAAGSNPNRVPEINIRGNSSLPGSIDELNAGVSAELNAPLILLNGFEISLQKLMDFNDDEVEKITILKDASATSIYGSRGANGVILITTVRPKSGELNLSLQIGLNIEAPDLSSYDLLNAADKLEVERMSGLYDSDDGPIKDMEYKADYYAKLAEVKRGVDTYWLSKPLRVGVGQRYALRMDWGTERFQTGVSLSYNDVKGVMKGSDRSTFSGSISMAYIYKNLKFQNELSIDFNKADNGTYGSFSDYARMNPYWRTHDEKGNIIAQYNRIGGSGNPIPNPLYDAAQNIKDESKYHMIINNFMAEWKIFNALTLRGKLGLSRTVSSSDYFLPPTHSKFLSGYNSAENFFRKGSYDYNTGETNLIDANITLDYAKVWNDKHQLFAGINYSISDQVDYDYYFSGEGYVTENLSYFPNALQYAQGSKPSGSESVTRRVGVTANINYTFDNRYYIDLSYRIDGSSLFGSDNRFAPFWSAGIGWNIHNEKFLKNSNIINRLRIKASIGETGTQNFSSYQAISTLKYYTSDKYLAWNAAELMSLGNDKLRWQTTLQSNAGLEFALLGNIVSGSIEFYKKKTSDLLSSMDLPLSHGFSSYIDNVGEVENKGYEASLTAILLRNSERRMILQVTGKIAYNKNVITKLSQAIKDQNELYLAENTDYVNLLYEGHSLNSIYAVPSLGIDPSTGEEVFLDRDGNVSRTWNPNAKILFGSLDPKYRGNASIYFAYGDFSVNLSFGYHWGGQQYNQTLINKVEVTNAQLNYNVDSRVKEERWFAEGDLKFFKKVSSSNTRASSRFVMDDNVFSLESAAVAYRWNADYLKNAGIDALNLRLNMSDIFYISSIKRERGTSYPFSRKIALTVSLTF